MKTLKCEEVYRSEYRNLAEARARIGEFLEEIYNPKPLHSSLGYFPPAEFEHLQSSRPRLVANLLERSTGDRGGCTRYQGSETGRASSSRLARTLGIGTEGWPSDWTVGLGRSGQHGDLVGRDLPPVRIHAGYIFRSG
jgi:hypothetical protein